jgi:hypothetical protein
MVAWRCGDGELVLLDCVYPFPTSPLGALVLFFSFSTSPEKRGKGERQLVKVLDNA